MDDNERDAQPFEVVGRGLSRELGASRAVVDKADNARGNFHFTLISYRSLSHPAFMVIMGLVLIVNLVVGTAFMMLGAWPVLGFCGLDVLLIYWAFRSNYRAGRARELVEVTPYQMTLTRVHPSGSREQFSFNPHWVRVRLAERADGRNEIALASHGQELGFARFLSDDERRDFAESLTFALMMARSAKPDPALER